jgi:type VI secretion system protein ImpC
LLGEGFAGEGWGFRPDARIELDGLPLHVYRSDGESCLKPCAETLLTEAAAERILDRGMMPLVSIKGVDRARLLRFQTVAAPPTPLPW